MKHRLAFFAVAASMMISAYGYAQTPQTWQPSEACVTPRSPQERSANVTLKADIPLQMKAGGSVTITWDAKGKFPEKSPLYLVIAAPGEVRFDVAGFKSAETGSAEAREVSADPDRTARLPGFLALTPGARAPLAIAFGEKESRAIVPLHQPGHAKGGSFGVRFFMAGPVEMQAALVSAGNCGEAILRTLSIPSFTVSAGAAEAVVQDPYDVETPEKAMISNSGRYLLQIFPDRYKVFDIRTGERLVDRAGHKPNFSPASRFVIANVGDTDGFEFEIVDLASGDVVARPAGPFVGWLANDSYIVDGEGGWGRLSIRPALISRVDAPEGGWWSGTDVERREGGDAHDERLSIRHPGSCHACPSWDASFMTIDMDAGAVVFSESSIYNKAEIDDLASGYSGCCSTTAGAKSFLTAHYFQGDRIVLSKDWRSSDPLKFSNVFEGSDIARVKILNRSLVKHRTIDPSGVAVAVAAVSTKTATRGDWRERTRGSGDDGDPLAGDANVDRDAPVLTRKILSPLAGFQVLTSRRAFRETVPFSNSPASEDGKARYESTTENATEDKIEKRTSALRTRLQDEIPALKPLLFQGKSTEYAETAYIGSGTEDPKARIDLSHHLDGLWRWEIGGKPIWLMQLLTIEGSGAFGAGAIVLLDGRTPNGKVLDLSNLLKDFWDGAYGATSQFTTIKPQLYLDRYLVMASVVRKTIAVYDLQAGKLVTILKDAQQADLLQDVVLSKDARSLLQINQDGQFFLHDIKSARPIISGRYADGEIILYTKEGYYWSSYEGAHSVQLRFPGLPGLYSFQQFAAVLDKPEIVSKRLIDVNYTPGLPALTPPPFVEASLLPGDANAAALRVHIRASSQGGLSRLRVYADGRLIRDTEAEGASFERDISLPLAGKARWLTVLALDKRGLVSRPQSLRLKPASDSTNRLFGIVAGIGDYPNPDLKLLYAASDAERLASALSNASKAYYSTPVINVLTDARATASAIQKTLEAIVAQAGEKDTIVFSFAGHGVADENGNYFLASSGFDINNVAGTGLSWTSVSKILSRAKARVVVILDACHSGLSGSQTLSTNDDAVKALLSGTHAPLLVLAASKGRQLSYEGEAWGGGAFTHALIGILAHPTLYDSDKNGSLEVSEIYRALRKTVGAATQGQQSPWLVRQDLIGDFALF